MFPKSVADENPMFHTPGKAKSYRPASGKLLPDLGARKVQVKPQRRVNPRIADTHRALMAVSDMNDMGHDIFFPRSDRNIKAYAYNEGSGTKLELERVNGVFELSVELVPCSQSTSKHSHFGFVFFTFCFGTDQKRLCEGSDCGSPKLTGACSAVRPTKEAYVATPLVSAGGRKFCKSRRDPADSRRRTVGRGTNRPKEGEREQHGKSNCSVKFERCGSRASCKGQESPVSPQLGRMGWAFLSLDMPSIEDGVHSASLAKARVKFIDGWGHHVTMGIQNFIWVTSIWAEKRRTERHQFWWADARRIVG